MTIPRFDDIKRQSEQAEQQAAIFRQMTGGVPATVYMQKGEDGFRVVVKVADGSPIQIGVLVDNLMNAVGLCCQQLGMTVKV